MTATALLPFISTPIGYGDEFAVPWARIALSLLFCLALAFGAIAWLRKRSGNTAMPSFASLLTQGEGANPRELELIERVQLSPGSHICVVRCGDLRLLLHVSAAGAQVLARMDSDATGGAWS